MIKYRAVVYGDKNFWKFTQQCDSKSDAIRRGKNLVKRNNVTNTEIVITEKNV